MRHKSLMLLAGVMFATGSTSAIAQDGDGGSSRNLVIQPYIEVAQVLSVELSPGDNVVTYTQLAAGVDVSATGRNSGGSVSVRYQRNIGYGDRVDSDTISGIARGYVALVPQTLNFEAGALASTTRVDGTGAVSPNALAVKDATGQIYSLYAGPTVNTQVGAVAVTANARVGYNRFETDSPTISPDGRVIDVFDDSVTYAGQVRAAIRAGDSFPVGLAATAGFYQEDISNLDQRIRDAYVRADVTVPVSESLAVVAGVGYEDVEVSSRDAVRDATGAPILGQDGRFVTDTSSPRTIAFDVDGLLWDVGIMWRPSSRTSLAARVGRRYDSTTYYGSFSYQPNARASLNVNVYDGITGFGGRLNNALAALDTDFEALRNPVTGELNGLVTGTEGTGLVNSLGSVRSSAFRGRGVNASYSYRMGRLNAAIGAGYDRREFIGAEGTVLEAADGVTDESIYIAGAVSRDLGSNANIAANAYVAKFNSGAGGFDSRGYGASLAYARAFTEKLQGRAAAAMDVIDSDLSAEDFAAASALLGLRYSF